MNVTIADFAPVDCVPDRASAKGNYYTRLVDDFVRSGMRCAKVTLRSDSEAAVLSTGLRNATYGMPEDIAVNKRGRDVYLTNNEVVG